MKVYVLVQYAPYEGGTLLGAYATESAATEACNAAAKRDKFASISGDWIEVHEVELDAAPHYYFPAS